MALLQIAEPNQSAAPHQHRLAVGIDLGTTNSLVATVRSGSAECLPDETGAVSLPSVVRYLENGGKTVGIRFNSPNPVGRLAPRIDGANGSGGKKQHFQAA